MIKKYSGHEKDGSKDSVEKDSRDTTEGVTVEIEDFSNNPELDSSVPAKSGDHVEDGRKDSVESGPHVKHNEPSEGEDNKKGCGLSNVTFNQDGNPSICKDGSILRSGEITIQKFCVGTPTVGRAKKVILVLAEGGAGKPEVVTNLVNYLKWNNKSRIKLEALKQSRSANPSIIHWINIYSTRNDLSFDISIIDLPACTESSEPTAIIRCKRVANLVHQLTESDAELGLDAILLVQKYSPQRETPHTLHSILGQNLRKNIYHFLTFSLKEFHKLDLTENEIELPLVDDAFFKSSYLMPRGISNAHDTSNINFRSIANHHFDTFIKFLQHCHQVELTQSSEVIKNRRNLEEQVTQIQSTISIWRNQEGDICKAKSTLADTEDKNKGSVQVKLTNGERAVNCQKCETTCHYPCKHTSVQACSCMNRISFVFGCRVCTGKCVPLHHMQDSFRYKTIEEKAEELKQHRERVGKAVTDLKATKEDVQKRAREINVCLQNLSKIAIEPTVLSIEGDLIKENVGKARNATILRERFKTFSKCNDQVVTFKDALKPKRSP